MAKNHAVFACVDCGQRTARWAGRCPSCGGWGTVGEALRASPTHPDPPPAVRLRDGDAPPDPRVATGLPGLDRVLGGGLVPASTVLLAGEPGIGKSTLLLQAVAALVDGGRECLVVSGEESRGQVAARAHRLGVGDRDVAFAPGRDLAHVLAVARASRPFLLAVDSIQTLRDTAGTQVPGGVAQVRTCADALVGLAKTDGIAVLLTGHVTKEGELAGPRALEHAVDAVLTFDGDPRSGLRVLAGGKNRFGAEGETAWFEMSARGLCEIDPTSLLVSGERQVGAAVALPQAGRRALAVEVQALVRPTDGPARRQATGIDLRRFQLIAAVLDRVGVPLGRAELFGAASGGVRVDDPACDLAVAAALASAAGGSPPPEAAAFVGEISLTGQIRSVPSMPQRLAAARAAGCRVVFAPRGHAEALGGMQVVSVGHVAEALAWSLPPARTRLSARSA
jgi:DNA repair protein RadA/Sms